MELKEKETEYQEERPLKSSGVKTTWKKEGKGGGGKGGRMGGGGGEEGGGPLSLATIINSHQSPTNIHEVHSLSFYLLTVPYLQTLQPHSELMSEFHFSVPTRALSNSLAFFII
jgi:hypothetical protein